MDEFSEYLKNHNLAVSIATDAYARAEKSGNEGAMKIVLDSLYDIEFSFYEVLVHLKNTCDPNPKIHRSLGDIITLQTKRLNIILELSSV